MTIMMLTPLYRDQRLRQGREKGRREQCWLCNLLGEIRMPVNDIRELPVAVFFQWLRLVSVEPHTARCSSSACPQSSPSQKVKHSVLGVHGPFSKDYLVDRSLLVLSTSTNCLLASDFRTATTPICDLLEVSL